MGATPPRKPRPPLPDGPFLVVGLARSGSAAALMLADRGAQARGCDPGPPNEARRLGDAGVEVLLDGDGTQLLEGVSTVGKTRGVPADAPAIKAARERGVPVVGEMELAWRG